MAYYHHTKELKEIKQPSDAPLQPHFVIILFDERYISHEGDERSRTHPGHGYPAYTETVHERKIYVTTDKAAWQKAIQGLYGDDQHRKDILAYEVMRQAKVKISVDVG